MSRPAVFFGLWVALSTGVGAALGQNATYRPPATDVGRLQDIGVVGRSDPMLNLGRIGGNYTGRFGNYGGNTNPLRSFGLGGPNTSVSRPRGLINSSAILPSYAGQSARVVSPNEFRRRDTSRRGTFESNRYNSVLTRQELVRGQIESARVRGSGPLADAYTVMKERERQMSPIGRVLYDANLLRPKSPLGQLAASSAGYARPGPPVTDEAARDLVKPAARDLTSVMAEVARERAPADALAARLEKQRREYYSSGVEFFRSANYVRARDCFDVCQTLDRKDPRAIMADALVAIEQGDVNRMVSDILRTLRLEASLDAMRVDVAAMYGDPAAFERVVDKANLIASLDGPDSFATGNLILSICAWLNGDLNTAVSAATTAAKSADEPTGLVIMRFADAVRASGRPTSKPAA